jgi:hypothetical protein
VVTLSSTTTVDSTALSTHHAGELSPMAHVQDRLSVA